MEYFKIHNILIIEDNIGDFTLINDYLEEQIAGLTIIHAKSFSEAKTILEDKTNSFDIVLLDLSLPDKDGEELISEIVLMSAGTPVVVLTGYSDIEFGIKSMSLGVADYLLKDDITAISLYKNVLYCLV